MSKCYSCGMKFKEKFFGLGYSSYLLKIGENEVLICQSCHVEKRRCGICKDYAPHGVPLSRYSKLLICEECSEKLEDKIEKDVKNVKDFLYA
jgi:hypothetical protein